MLPDKNLCTGCGVCISVCSYNCLSFKEDEEGFRQISIEKELCINCGKCERFCPILDRSPVKNRSKDKIQVFACWNKDKKVRQQSSSGGFFPALADTFLKEEKSVVYGATMQKDLQVVHIPVTYKTDLSKIQGSKYLQSKVHHLFPSIKKQLQEGQKVLFSGTPCQIGGLYNYLNNTYENLYTCEVVCHGIPSSLFFSKHIDWLKQKYRTPITHVAFRSKSICWTIPVSRYRFGNKRKKEFRTIENPFMNFFYAGLNLRQSCYHCQYSRLPRVADITMGDFWGVRLSKKISFLEKEKGISLILLNNQRGDELYEKVKNQLNSESRSIEEAISGNIHIIQPVDFNSRYQLRSKVFHELQLDGLEKLTDKYLPLSFKEKISIQLGKVGMKIYYYFKNLHRLF